MCGFIHTLPTLWGCAFRRLRRLLRTNAYAAAMHKMACFESAAIVSECEQITQGGRTVCYWYTKYPPGSLSASTVGGRRIVRSFNNRRMVCAGHSTIVRSSGQQKLHGVCLALGHNTRRVKPGTHHAIFVFCWTQRQRKADCRMVCAQQRRSSSVDFTNATVVGPIRKTNRSNNCCMVCAGQIHLSHQPTGHRPITVKHFRDA